MVSTVTLSPGTPTSTKSLLWHPCLIQMITDQPCLDHNVNELLGQVNPGYSSHQRVKTSLLWERRSRDQVMSLPPQASRCIGKNNTAMDMTHNCKKKKKLRHLVSINIGLNEDMIYIQQESTIITETKTLLVYDI